MTLRYHHGPSLRTRTRHNIWSPNLGVFAVAVAGVLCAFPASWTRYLDSVSAVGLVRSPCRCCFLELSGYCVNAV